MLIKEYRIPLPLTVEEYRIAQLYMIAKKSREESKGTESGVEILVNEPYSDGPGGSGQFTHKIYHVGSHLPGWFKSLLPKSALTVEEEAWNAYPYTKTRFKCPFVEKFSLEIETYYTPDGGDKENVFNLSESEKRSRIVDLIDVVKDQEGSVYEDPEKEDPTLFTSEKTRRGPLSADWLEEFSEACRGQQQPTKDGKAIMCAYKLCKVEFRYWGMQSKIERFIHDVALRKTMLKAHSQAWTWQDEWFGLTMEDIRAIEKETAEMLRKTMGGGLSGEEGGDEGEYRAGFDLESSAQVEVDVSGNNTTKAQFSSIEYSEADVPKILSPKPARVRKSDGNEDNSEDGEQDDEEEEDDEFFDAREQWEERVSLAKWSSMDFENADLDLDQRRIDMGQDEPMINFRRAQSMHEKSLSTPLDRGGIPNMPMSARPHSAGLSAGGGRMQPVIDINRSSEDYCPTQVLILVMHGGSVLDGPMDPSVRKSDVTTFRGAFETIIRNHYPGLLGQVAIKCVPCPAICTEALAVLSSLSPYSFDVIPSLNNIGQQEDFVVSNDRLPIGTIPIFATSSPDYHTSVNKVANSANQVFADFLNSEEGQGFCGQVVLIGDSMGAILAYDALCHSQIKRSSSDGSVNDNDHLHHHRNRSQSGESRSSSPKIDSASESHQQHQNRSRHLSIRKDHVPLSSSTSTSTQVNEEIRFDFDVSDFFAFGSPLGMLLAYRKLQQTHSKGTGGSALHHNKLPIVPRPNIQQMYNLFHPTDPLTCRIEPLLSAPFSGVPPVNVSRYQTYPMGDGACYSLIEFIQGNTGLFSEGLSNPHRGFPSHHHHHHQRRASEESIISGVVDSQQLHTINVLKPKWWGGRRIDYALYCPEGLSNFPTNSLPHLFHSSFWESADVISFVLRQLVRCHDLVAANPGAAFSSSVNPGLNVSQMLEIDQPREKWMKKRTSVKIRNGAPNHRGNDVIVKEGNRQVLSGRFSYGPLDMAALTGEKVDVHLMKDPSKGDWTIITTEMTDKHGRLAYTLPPEHVLGYGVYPIRMVVRGDHTCLYMTLAVVPPKTECVVFSIDGSFAASMSVTGKDPKVKPGAVDIVRHWLDLGYLIVYVTARPDMQMQRVVAWLTQHNFPKGLVSFADGFTTDPLRHKADYLKSLMQEQEINIHAAYGSSKDINVYSTLGLKNEEMYIIGKPSRRQSQLPVNWIANGYTEHLANLNTPGGSRPAQGNARMVIPKGAVLGNPVHAGGLQRRRTFKATAARTSSYPYGAPPDSSQPSAAPGTT